MGAVLTLSMPIIYPNNPKNGFIGIAGIDFTYENLRKNLGKFGDLLSNDKYYAFIIDNNGILLKLILNCKFLGIVYYHPNLKIPVGF